MCIDAALFESQSTSNLFRHPGCSVAPGWTLMYMLCNRRQTRHDADRNMLLQSVVFETTPEGRDSEVKG